jgi:archaellum component FlaC
MPTKVELETRIDDLKHQIRRLERSVNQARLDVKELPTTAYNSF